MKSTSANRKANARAKRKKKKLGWRLKVNSFEVGDHVACGDNGEHEGVVESFAIIISKNGFGTQRRFYRIRILEPHPLGSKYLSQDGKHMERLPSVEELLGENYLA